MSTHKKYNYPKQISIIRFLFNANSISRNPIPYHKKFFAETGDNFAIRINKSKYVVLSRDNEVANYILQSNHRNFQKSELQTSYLSKYLGNGLLTVNGNFWLRQRRLIQPAFHKQKMNQLVSVMQEIIELKLSHLPQNQPTAIFPILDKLAFDVVAQSLFQSTTLTPKFLRLKYIIEAVQSFVVKEIRLPHKSWWYKLSGLTQKHKNLALESNSILKEIITERKASEANHNDLLQMLMDTKYEDTGAPMDEAQLIDEIKILFVAGHETTANALTFTIYLLATHPEWQEILYNEITSVEKSTTAIIEQLQQLVYAKAVLNESMRLYPPAWITDRVNLNDDTLAGYSIKKGTLIGVSFYELHRNPKYWESPDSFKPERFLGEQKKESMRYFYPFGAGPRLCIGMGFASYEMSLAIAYIVKNYHIKTSQKTVAINPLITLKPVGVTVSFSKR